MRTLLLPLLFALAACGPPPAGPPGAPTLSPLPGDWRAGRTETVYVPVYSSIYDQDHTRTLDLTVTLSVRNTDPEHPIALGSVRYHGTAGELLHTYVETPGLLAPLGSVQVVVAEDDVAGGVGASFLVDWSAAAAVSAPVIEAVMLSTASSQGISFLTEGRVVRRVDQEAQEEVAPGELSPPR